MQNELFDVVSTSRVEKVDFWNVVARRKLGKTNTWSWYKIEWVGDSAILVGGETALITKGKNKGKKKWDGADKVIISEAEYDEAAKQYELSTGKCSSCQGSGQEFKSWNHLTGTDYKTCKRCNGKGVVNNAE